jgi:hypothetical protein
LRTEIAQLNFTIKVIRSFQSANAKAMAETMLDIIQDQSPRNTLVAVGQGYVERNTWNRKRRECFSLADSLLTVAFENVGDLR